MKAWLQRMWASEPVRTALYPLIALGVGALVRQGIVDQSVAAYVLALVVAILGVPVTALLRAQVTPPANLQQAVTEKAEEIAAPLVVQAQELIEQATKVNLPPQVIDAVNRVRATVDNYVGDHRLP